MGRTSTSSLLARGPALPFLAALACALALLCATRASGEGMHVPGQTAAQSAPSVPGAVTTTVEECLTATAQTERAVTFSGEMSLVPGAARMSMHIEVQERTPGESTYRAVEAPGPGGWRSSDSKVKVYKYLKQVTNLSAPASYRALVHFRWLSSKGHVIKRAERFTASCLQPEPVSQPINPTPEKPSSGSTPSGSMPSGTTPSGSTTPSASA